MQPRLTAALLCAVLGATGCNLFGGESAESVAARREADGKAVGGACRHAGRAIEDCYTLNRRADKAAVYAGWREMNDYMRENKLEPVLPALNTETVAQAEGEGKRARADKAAEKHGEKGSEKGSDRSVDKASDKSRTKDSGAVMPEKSRKDES
jgi:hypothetical protein